MLMMKYYFFVYYTVQAASASDKGETRHRTLLQFILPSYTDYHDAIPTPPTTHTNHQPQFLDLELDPTCRFNDPFNKTSWHAMCYSLYGE